MNNNYQKDVNLATKAMFEADEFGKAVCNMEINKTPEAKRNLAISIANMHIAMQAVMMEYGIENEDISEIINEYVKERS